jgi:UDP-N-acetylmuramyl pentapeptide phosphotransferase/UDP-N-acetylglucosamine-1-phosphate transferase
MTSLVSDFFPAASGACVALVVSMILVKTKNFHGKYSFDSQDGVQKHHDEPTPRIGGLAILAGLTAAWISATGETRAMLALIGLTGLPALGFGLVEDVTQKVGVKWRLTATVFSGLIFTVVSGYVVPSVGLSWLDLALSYGWVAAAFTAFAIGGVANSINIIDGFHGLASGTLMVIFLAFAIVFARVGDEIMLAVSVIMLCVTAGFFVVNFPLGKLFLGDAGAYYAGYMVAVLGVMLPVRNPSVSPWVSLLILGYPVMETVFSIIRRRFDGHCIGAPDSKHLHHLVYRRWAVPLAQRFNIKCSDNALTSIILWALPAVTLLAVALIDLNSDQPGILMAAAVVLYMVFYRSADHGLRE